MSLRYRYPGSCHCGNIAVHLTSDRTPAELGSRSDGCSFCNKHHAIYTSDPRGEVQLRFRAGGLVQRYRFATETADFLLCRACGMLVAAYVPDPPRAVVNVHALDARAVFLANPVQVADLSDESSEARRARRAERWTPVV